jgi:hypothetical protein
VTLTFLEKGESKNEESLLASLFKSTKAWTEQMVVIVGESASGI